MWALGTREWAQTMIITTSLWYENQLLAGLLFLLGPLCEPCFFLPVQRALSCPLLLSQCMGLFPNQTAMHLWQPDSGKQGGNLCLKGGCDWTEARVQKCLSGPVYPNCMSRMRCSQNRSEILHGWVFDLVYFALFLLYSSFQDVREDGGNELWLRWTSSLKNLQLSAPANTSFFI